MNPVLVSSEAEAEGAERHRVAATLRLGRLGHIRYRSAGKRGTNAGRRVHPHPLGYGSLNFTSETLRTPSFIYFSYLFEFSSNSFSRWRLAVLRSRVVAPNGCKIIGFERLQ